MGRRARLSILVAVALAAAAAILVLPRGDGRIAELRSMSNWPADCRTTTERPSRLPEPRRWTRAIETASTNCEFDGPALTYARFKDAQSVTTSVRQVPPKHSYCAAGKEVVETSFGFVNLDDKRSLALLCLRLKGRLVLRKADLHSLI